MPRLLEHIDNAVGVALHFNTVCCQPEMPTDLQALENE